VSLDSDLPTGNIELFPGIFLPASGITRDETIRQHGRQLLDDGFLIVRRGECRLVVFGVSVFSKELATVTYDNET
jgi:hypothetical protein